MCIFLYILKKYTCIYTCAYYLKNYIYNYIYIYYKNKKSIEIISNC